MEFSQAELENVIKNCTLSTQPLKLKTFPVKLKLKYMLLTLIINEFEENVKYSEKQVNEILKNVYYDFATIRRYLIDYNFLQRTNDGSIYWKN